MARKFFKIIFLFVALANIQATAQLRIVQLMEGEIRAGGDNSARRLSPSMMLWAINTFQAKAPRCFSRLVSALNSFTIFALWLSSISAARDTTISALPLVLSSVVNLRNNEDISKTIIVDTLPVMH